MNFIITLIGLVCAVFIICGIASAPMFFQDILPKPVAIVLSIALFINIIAIPISLIAHSTKQNQTPKKDSQDEKENSTSSN